MTPLSSKSPGRCGDSWQIGLSTLMPSMAASTTEPSPRSPTTKRNLIEPSSSLGSFGTSLDLFQPPPALLTGPTVSVSQLEPSSKEMSTSRTSALGDAPQSLAYHRQYESRLPLEHSMTGEIRVVDPPSTSSSTPFPVR